MGINNRNNVEFRMYQHQHFNLNSPPSLNNKAVYFQITLFTAGKLC